MNEDRLMISLIWILGLGRESRCWSSLGRGKRAREIGGGGSWKDGDGFKERNTWRGLIEENPLIDDLIGDL
jgi:hypothetical protein